MKRLPLIAIVVFALTAACSAKNDAKNDAGAPPPPERADPGPISPNSWLINPPNQPAR
jgi:hypothetical protein